MKSQLENYGSMYLNELFNFVIRTSSSYNIDESHSLGHSMEVYYFANKLFENELESGRIDSNKKKIIDICAILHDMCDNKYMDEETGIKNINDFLKNKISEYEITIVNNVITSMSYSKIKEVGLPKLGENMDIFHIVRQADILAAYDFERCMIYGMMMYHDSYKEVFKKAEKLFEIRVLCHINDGTFVSEYALELAKVLHTKAEKRINDLRKFYDFYN